jgi:hypothetical protein
MDFTKRGNSALECTYNHACHSIRATVIAIIDAHTITQKPAISKQFAHTINGHVQEIVLFYPLQRKTMKSGIVVNIPHRRSIRQVIMDTSNS